MKHHEVSLAEYAAFLDKSTHPVSNVRPVAAGFFNAKLRSTGRDLMRTHQTAHNLSVHGYFNEGVRCSRACQRRGIQLVVEGNETFGPSTRAIISLWITKLRVLLLKKPGVSMTFWR